MSVIERLKEVCCKTAVARVIQESSLCWAGRVPRVQNWVGGKRRSRSGTEERCALTAFVSMPFKCHLAKQPGCIRAAWQADQSCGSLAYMSAKKGRRAGTAK